MQFASNFNPLSLLTLLILVFTSYAKSDDEDSQAGNRIISVDKQTQIVSGLKTVILHGVTQTTEFETMGKVINIEPLFSLRSRYLVARAELAAAEAKLKQSEQNLKRHNELFREGVTAKRFLQELIAQKSSDQALVDANRVKLAGVINELRINWGKILTDWVTTKHSEKLDRLLSGRQVLVQVVLPANMPLSPSLNRVLLDVSGQREHAQPASLVSRAPQMDSAFQGENYFFLSNSGRLQMGMKTNVWIPESSSGESGVVVPESAFVWYMDQLYAYVKSAQDKFERREIKKYTRIGSQYFVQEDLKQGDEVVVVGGQMLLSEELRQQIPDED